MKSLQYNMNNRLKNLIPFSAIVVAVGGGDGEETDVQLESLL